MLLQILDHAQSTTLTLVALYNLQSMSLFFFIISLKHMNLFIFHNNYNAKKISFLYDYFVDYFVLVSMCGLQSP